MADPSEDYKNRLARQKKKIAYLRRQRRLYLSIISEVENLDPLTFRHADDCVNYVMRSLKYNNIIKDIEYAEVADAVETWLAKKAQVK